MKTTIDLPDDLLIAAKKRAADPRGWGFTLTNLLEFWSIVTHAKASGRPSTTAEASSFVQALVHSARAHIWSPSGGSRSVCRNSQLL